MIESIFGDLRFAFRLARKNPGFAAIVVVTLALGIGVNTAIFSVVNAVLLRPLPYEKPQQLVALNDSLPTVGFPLAGLSESEYLTLRRESKTLVQLEQGDGTTMTLTGLGEPERVQVGVVSSNFFDTTNARDWNTHGSWCKKD